MRSASVSAIRSTLGRYSLLLGIAAVASLALAGVTSVLAPSLGRAVMGLVAIAAGLFALYVIGAFAEVRAGVMARQTRYGANAIVMALAFLGILGVLNALAAQTHLRTDVTAGGQYTLSRQTIAVLKDLSQPVKVTGFFNKEPAAQAGQEEAGNRLMEYRFQTDKLSFEFVDPDEKPGIARQYEIKDYGALVFEAGSRRKQVFGLSEQDFTGAILNVTGKEQQKIYFVEGHGERAIDSADSQSFSQVRDGLIADNYQVQSINLSTVAALPSDVAVLGIAGPKRPFLEPEVQLVDRYLEGGGKALILLDPNPSPELRRLLLKWGVEVKDGLVVDTQSYVNPDLTVPLARGGQYTFGQVTKDLQASFFPGAAGLTPSVPEDDRDHVAVTPLAATTDRSYLETDPQKIEFTPNADSIGPFLLGLTVEANKPVGQRPVRPVPPQPGQPLPANQPAQNPTRLVVFADSDFATNNFFYSLSNSDLLLNSVNWLTAQESLISIRPKPPEFRRLDITRRTFDFILYSSAALWPLAVLLAGGFVWWRRR